MPCSYCDIPGHTREVCPERLEDKHEGRGHVDLRDDESRDDDPGHAAATAKTLAMADDEDLEAAGIDPDEYDDAPAEWRCPDCGERRRTYDGDEPSGRCLTCGATVDWERADDREVRCDGGTDPCAIACPNCGTEHSLDAGGDHCRECNGFLPEATPKQQRLLGKRMEQQIRHEQGYVTVGGYVESIHGDDADEDLATDGGRPTQLPLAETQTAGFGLANGKVADHLVLAFDHQRPAITVRHDRVDHPDPMDDREPRTTTLECVTVTPTGDRRDTKVEIGTRHGTDRVVVETHDHAPRAYVRHERDDGGWTEQAAWELHPATGISQVGGETIADGGTVGTTTDDDGLADQPTPSSVAELTLVRERDRAPINAFLEQRHPLGSVPGWKACFSARYRDTIVAVVVLGRPVSAHNDDGTELSVTRFCRRDDRPANTGSWLIARARHWVALEGYDRGERTRERVKPDIEFADLETHATLVRCKSCGYREVVTGDIGDACRDCCDDPRHHGSPLIDRNTAVDLAAAPFEERLAALEDGPVRDEVLELYETLFPPWEEREVSDRDE